MISDREITKKKKHTPHPCHMFEHDTGEGLTTCFPTVQRPMTNEWTDRRVEYKTTWVESRVRFELTLQVKALTLTPDGHT